MGLILDYRKIAKQKTKIPTSTVNKYCNTPPVYPPYLCSRAADCLGFGWVFLVFTALYQY